MLGYHQLDPKELTSVKKIVKKYETFSNQENAFENIVCEMAPIWIGGDEL